MKLPAHAIAQIKAVNEGENVRWFCVCGTSETCDPGAAWTIMSWHLVNGELKVTETGTPVPGNRVRVYAPDCGRELFTGQEVPGAAPWQFWTRVVPDHGHIDLPPYYRIEELP